MPSLPPHPARPPPVRSSLSVRTCLLALVLVASLPTLAVLGVQMVRDDGALDAAHAAGAALVAMVVGVLLALACARQLRADLARLAHPGARSTSAARRSAIAELSRLEQALHQARRHDEAARDRLEARAYTLQMLFDRSPVGLAIAQDRAGRQVWHNAAMERLLGTSAQVLHEGLPLAPAAWPLQRAARLGDTVHGLELELAGPDRASTFVLASAVPLRDDQGRPCGAVCALVDISERKRADAQARAGEGLLRERQRLVEQAQATGEVGFFHHALTTDRMTWSSGQNALFGAPLPRGAGLHEWFARIHDDDRSRVEREFWTACALHRPRLSVDYRLARTDGVERWLSSRLGLRYDARGHATEVSGVTLDVSQAKRDEQQGRRTTEDALRAQHAAETANRAKDDLLVLLSHELRNPLGAISAAADVLAVAPPGSSSAREARDVVARQTVQLVHRMGELLDLSRALSGTLLLATQRLDLAALAGRVTQAFAAEADPRAHDLHGTGEAAWVHGDPLRLHQTVHHLVRAVLAQSTAGTAVDLQVRTEGAMVELAVQAGAGRALSTVTGAAAIGLVLARRLAELHGGSLVVRDSGAPGVTLRLPAVDAPEASAPADLPSAPASLPASRRRKVLVVEDNEDVLCALRAKLELDGHSVDTAVDGIAGLDRLLALQPEVSIVDIGLPGLTGYELARHARAAGYAGRMIALSGFGSGPDADSARVAGFDAYLIKPVDRHQLRASLNEE